MKADEIEDLFAQPVFRAAIDDIASTGVRVAMEPTPGALPYAVVAGRSNARWWLIPLQNGRTSGSAMALFQPLLLSARLIKALIVGSSVLGLSRLWARKRLYLSGENTLDRYFRNTPKPVYAYFTGTDSPHRKVAVQIMDEQGRLKGYAKLTRSKAVKPLLIHEAAMLKRVKKLNLKSAHVPEVLFAGEQNGATYLVTDTRKTAFTRSTNRFTAAHRTFLQEMTAKTARSALPISETVVVFRHRVAHARARLEPTWHQRLDAAIAALAAQSDTVLPANLSHGDLTPWNTFITRDRLYVFDWEYAAESAPCGIDRVHFALNEPRLRNKPTAGKLAGAMMSLSEPWIGLTAQERTLLLIIYVLTQALRQIERHPEDERLISDWDGAQGQARLLDALLDQSTG